VSQPLQDFDSLLEHADLFGLVLETPFLLFHVLELGTHIVVVDPEHPQLLDQVLVLTFHTLQ
jgi:hypothetical protein